MMATMLPDALSFPKSGDESTVCPGSFLLLGPLAGNVQTLDEREAARPATRHVCLDAEEGVLGIRAAGYLDEHVIAPLYQVKLFPRDVHHMGVGHSRRWAIAKAHVVHFEMDIAVGYLEVPHQWFASG